MRKRSRQLPVLVAAAIASAAAMAAPARRCASSGAGAATGHEPSGRRWGIGLEVELVVRRGRDRPRGDEERQPQAEVVIEHAGEALRSENWNSPNGEGESARLGSL
jgi:hypothetical protein